MPRGMTEREADDLERVIGDYLAAMAVGWLCVTRTPVGIRINNSDEVISSGAFTSGPLTFVHPVSTSTAEVVFRINLGLAPIEIGSKEQWHRVREWLALFGPMVMGEEI